MEVPKILHDIVDGFEHNETHYYPSPISACSLNTTIYRGVINCSNCNFLRREHFLVHSGLWSRFEEAIKQRPDDEPIMLPLSVRPKAAKFLESYFRRPVKYYISHWIPHESKQMEILVNVIDPLLEHRKQDLEFCLDRLDFDLNRLCVFWRFIERRVWTTYHSVSS